MDPKPLLTRPWVGPSSCEGGTCSLAVIAATVFSLWDSASRGVKRPLFVAKVAASSASSCDVARPTLYDPVCDPNCNTSNLSPNTTIWQVSGMSHRRVVIRIVLSLSKCVRGMAGLVLEGRDQVASAPQALEFT